MKPGLSLILCARNDTYQGNPVYRLQTSLNYLADNLRKLSLDDAVEVIVTDWGSETPLKEVLNLNATAAKITRFLEVPIAVVKEVQKDSPFAEVLALNAAARRAGGQFIGRIDQDTLAGKHFLKNFFAWVDGSRNPGGDLKTSYLFSKRRQIPFNVAMRVTSLDKIKFYLRLCGRQLLVEEWPPFFFNSPVGIMILSRDLWMACGGYDERLLYWGWMEVDLAHRLKTKHAVMDIGPLIRHDFYHLEHYDPRLPRKTPRKMNPMESENLPYHPNGEDWGLVNYPLTLSGYTGRSGAKKFGDSLATVGGGKWRDVICAIASAFYESCYRAARPAYRKLRAILKPVNPKI
jgi:hypothetical protein